MPVAATIGSTLIKELNSVLLGMGRYVSPNDIRITRWLRAADQLMNADPVEALTVKAITYSLTGNTGQAIYYLDNAAIAGPSNPMVLLNRCTTLTNLGFLSEAQSVFARVGSPKAGLFPMAASLGFNCGAFRAMAAVIEEARKMKLDTDFLQGAPIEDAANLLTSKGLDDSFLASQLDVAGEIMREVGTMFMGDAELFVANDHEDPLLSLVYQLPVNAYEAEELDSELAIRLIRKKIALSPFVSIGFVSGLMAENERYPERDTAIRI